MRAIVALGSNLGDRRAHLEGGLRALATLGTVLPSPLVLETPDATGTGPDYLNTVAYLDTDLTDPRRLLEALLRIELRLGRVRPAPPNAPRTLDLDLVCAEAWRGVWRWPAPPDLAGCGPCFSLRLPHPRAAGRAFVREPLARLDGGDGLLAALNICAGESE